MPCEVVPAVVAAHSPVGGMDVAVSSYAASTASIRRTVSAAMPLVAAAGTVWVIAPSAAAVRSAVFRTVPSAATTLSVKVAGTPVSTKVSRALWSSIVPVTLKAVLGAVVSGAVSRVATSWLWLNSNSPMGAVPSLMTRRIRPAGQVSAG